MGGSLLKQGVKVHNQGTGGGGIVGLWRMVQGRGGQGTVKVVQGA